jgi:4-diphosphocytidyl-2C-methyl-D-erythritol kinase
MTDLMTDDERHAAAKKLARKHNEEIEQLRSEYATANEIAQAVARHDHEVAEVLGDLNQPCVGTMNGPGA